VVNKFVLCAIAIDSEHAYDTESKGAERMKIKTEDLTGPALDWAVGQALKLPAPYWDERGCCAPYSTSWQVGGPIIEREEIGLRRNAPCSTGREWEASGSITAKGAGYRWGYGPTPLIAAMRCFVASKLGDIVEIPEELV
jgi:hypothetical protein